MKKQRIVKHPVRASQSKRLDPRAGHIRGRVIDVKGCGLSRTRVCIRELDKCTLTDDRGHFVLINIPPAGYTLIAEREDASTHLVATDIPVKQGDNPGHILVMRAIDDRD